MTTPSGSSSSSSSISGHHHAATPKCNNDCQTAKRNARLADALGISQEGRESNGNSVINKSVVYSEELVGFARGNLKFLGLVEKTFAECVIFILSSVLNKMGFLFLSFQVCFI